MKHALKRNSTTPLYQQLSNIIKQRILSGEWGGENGQLPTEPELCAEFNVARGTIRQALRQLEHERVVRRKRGLGTFVDLVSQPQENISQIGLVVPYVRDSFITTILHGVEQTASREQISVTFKHVANDFNQQSLILKDLANQNLAGIILYPTDSVHFESVNDLIQSGYPIVLIDRYMRGLMTDYVVADNFGGALQAVQHLISLGHQQIGFVIWRDNAISLEHRELGYRQALTEAKLPVEPTMVCEVESYPEINIEPLFDFLRQEPRLTALFAANDQIALAIYKVARQMGLRIPDDIAVVGFGDIDMVNYLDVPLTTVALPTYEIGQHAVEMLLRRIQGESTGWQRMVLPTRLVIRQSCGSIRQPAI